jgi:hypothetical protein
MAFPDTSWHVLSPTFIGATVMTSTTRVKPLTCSWYFLEVVRKRRVVVR